MKIQCIQLGNVLGGGGEADIYETDQPNMVCKICRPDKLTSALQKKFEIMTTRKISVSSGLCWPTEAMYNAKWVFRGFLMPKVGGETLRMSIFNLQWYCRHSKFDRRDLVQTAVSILNVLHMLIIQGPSLGTLTRIISISSRFSCTMLAVLIDSNGRLAALYLGDAESLDEQTF